MFLFMNVYRKTTRLLHQYIIFEKRKVVLSLSSIRRISTVNAQVLSNGGYGLSKSLLVSVNSGSDIAEQQTNKFLFNCGEGTIRLCKFHEHAVPSFGAIHDVKNIFITHGRLQNIAGLKAILLTSSCKNVRNLYGPAGLTRKDILAYKKTFDPIQDVVDVTADDKQCYEDNSVQIECVSLAPVLSPECAEPCLAPSDQQTHENLNIKRILSSIVYIIKHKVSHIPAIIILECPDERYIKSLLESEILQRHQSENGTVVFHLSPVGIVQDPRYQLFINRFPESSKQLHIDESRNTKAFDHVRNHQCILSKLDDSVFPVLPLCKKNGQELNVSQNDIKDKADRRVTPVDCGHVEAFCTDKHRYVSQESSLHLHMSQNMEDLFEEKKLYVAEIIKKLEKRPLVTAEYPDILFLGTGGVWTNLRNSSGIYVQLSPDTAILLDCGEGTYTQMCLFFGDKTKEMLRKIKCVFISHMHRDHYSGVTTLLKQRYEAFEGPVPKVAILGERHLKDYLTQSMEWTELHNALLNTEFYASPDFREKEEKKICELLTLSEVKPVRALHIIQAHSLSLKLKSSVHLVYSGDTVPTITLAQAGYGCDILIHEATFQDKQAAKEKYHSTVSSAVRLGEMMYAKHTILTHFAAEKMNAENGELVLSRPKVTVAMDFMRIRPSDLQYTHLLNPFLFN